MAIALQEESPPSQSLAHDIGSYFYVAIRLLPPLGFDRHPDFKSCTKEVRRRFVTEAGIWRTGVGYYIVDGPPHSDTIIDELRNIILGNLFHQECRDSLQRAGLPLEFDCTRELGPPGELITYEQFSKVLQDALEPVEPV